jgi:hypothetical protein
MSIANRVLGLAVLPALIVNKAISLVPSRHRPWRVRT